MKSSIVCHYLGDTFIFLKAKRPVFHFLDLDGAGLNLMRKFAKQT